jgi:hypothetical protein
VIGTCQQGHRGRHEFIRFLNHLERQLPADQQVHLIMDNYGTTRAPRYSDAQAEKAEPVSLPFHPRPAVLG